MNKQELFEGLADWELQSVGRAVRGVMDARRTGSKSGCGICALIGEQDFPSELEGGGFLYGDDVVRALAPEWPLFSGVADYPIPGGEGAYDTLSLWQGEQLEHRLSLLQFMLDEINAELESRNEEAV